MRTTVGVIAVALVVAAGAEALGVKEERAYTVPTPAFAGPKAPEDDLRLVEDSGIPLGEYILSEESRTEGGRTVVSRTYRRAGRSEQDEQPAAMVASATEELHLSMPSLAEAVSRFGLPTRVFVSESDYYLSVSVDYGNVRFYFGDDLSRADEIRFEHTIPAYRFRHAVGVGSSLGEVVALLGQPVRTAKGEEISWGDRVLSYYGEGSWQAQYISYDSEGVRFFFRDEKVMSMYLFDPHPVIPIKPWGDAREADLSSLADAADNGFIRTLWFSASTVFPGSAAGIAGKVIEQGKNPGLGVRALHARGLTGKGVLVAVIDQNLPGTHHPEYAGKVVSYYDTGCDEPADQGSMHGPAVLSLLVGTTTGTAPDARVLYAASPPYTEDAKYYARALRWIIAENANLPEGEKIRLVSVSASPSGPGSPFTRGGADWDAAVELAEAAGMLVLDGTRNHGRFDVGYYDPDRPDRLASCSPGYAHLDHEVLTGRILTPCCYRTQAEHYASDSPSYQYTGEGGLSWGIPYAAGVLAMGWQVNPSLTGQEMLAILERTAFRLRGGYRMIDPASFVAAVEKAVKR